MCLGVLPTYVSIGKCWIPGTGVTEVVSCYVGNEPVVSNLFIFISCTLVFCLCTCLCEGVGSLELKLQTVVSRHVGTRS